MRKSILATCILFTAFAIPAISFTQEKDKPAETAKPTEPAEPIHFYHLTLVVQDVDSAGKPFNSRSYATLISTDRYRPSSIRADSQVPFRKGSDGSLQYYKASVKFDLREVREKDHQISFFILGDVNSYVPASSDANLPPVTRNNQWDANVVIPISKPTVIFSSDALESKNAMQVVATITPIQ